MKILKDDDLIVPKCQFCLHNSCVFYIENKIIYLYSRPPGMEILINLKHLIGKEFIINYRKKIKDILENRNQKYLNDVTAIDGDCFGLETNFKSTKNNFNISYQTIRINVNRTLFKLDLKGIYLLNLDRLSTLTKVLEQL